VPDGAVLEGGDLEEDMLDKAWGVEPDFRLGCQAVSQDEGLVVGSIQPRQNVTLFK
jgi:ferredoxin